MSAAMALRLLFGVLCGGVLAWVVWDRSERELADRAGREEHERPRFLPFGGYYYLPMMMLLYPILGVIVGGAQMAVQLTLCALMRVFLELGVYYVLLMAVMPWLRRWVSARVCAMLWLLPDWIYVFVGRLDLPTDGKKLVLHAPGTLVYVLLAVWTVGAAGVMVWKIGSHLAFRRRILKNAVPVTDRQTLHVWEIELERAWIKNANGSSCAPTRSRRRCPSACITGRPASCCPCASIRRRSCRSSCGMRSSISPAATRRRNSS